MPGNPSFIKEEIHVSRLNSIFRSWNGMEIIDYSFLIIEKDKSRAIPRMLY